MKMNSESLGTLQNSETLNALKISEAERIQQTAATPAPGVKDVCIFLSAYAAWLLGSAATCIRIEKNVKRMAEAWQTSVDMVIMPSHVQMVVWDRAHEHSYSNTECIRHTGISFHINTRLSKLSWEVTDRRISFEEAQTQFIDIQHTPVENQRFVLIMASLANASFCRLFDGDIPSMIIVFIATLAGYRLKQLLLGRWHVDVRCVFFLCAFFSAVIGAAGHVFGIGETPQTALATSVLYLIPGIPYINSVSDLLDGHYLSAYARFMNAAVLTACLSAGLCGGLLLMNLNWF